jgi:streptogramin lyase
MPHPYRRPVALLLGCCGAIFVLAGCALAGPTTNAPRSPDVADIGILTDYPLPADRGPWELQWDAARNSIWFAEGQHTSQTLDRVASIDVGTNILREWSVITSAGQVHGTVLDSNGDLWFTEHSGQRVGRLHPATNTITEWSLPTVNFPHAIAVDDIDPNNVLIWFSEREVDRVTSFNPVTGEYRRHTVPFSGAWPHGISVAPDHSLWVVDTCDYRVGHFVPGVDDAWTLWQSPTNGQCGPPHIGPLFGVLSGGNLWYSEPDNANLVRLDPAADSFSIWHDSGSGSRQLTQIGLDPDGNVFFTQMRDDRIGRLEPDGATPPTVVAVTPVTASLATPVGGQATAVSVVYTPIVTQLTPVERVVTGTRTGGIVAWRLSVGTPTPLAVGPARAVYGGGGFWVSEVAPNTVARFAPYTPTGGPSATVTPPPTDTPIGGVPSATPPPPASPSLTPVPASPTAVASSPTRTPAPPPATSTPCDLSFSDVHAADYFYTPVLYLACRGVVSGYGDGTFRPYNTTPRAQMVKIVVLGFGVPGPSVTPVGGYTFADVPPANPFFAVIEAAGAHQIVGGYTCGGPGELCDAQHRPYFRPNASVTRGQLAKIVVGAAAWPLIDPAAGTFADVAPGSAFYQFVETAACRGVISGYTCGGPGEDCDAGHRPYFRQYNNSTRGQIAKIVYGALTAGSSCAPAVK